MPSAVHGVLFDLDDTLFDHTHATRQALAALHSMEPTLSVWTREDLERHHSHALETMHREVLAGRVSIDDARAERFRRLLELAHGGPAAESRAPELARRYREHYERAWRPVPGAMELVAALATAGCAVAIVTNNIRAEQEMKLRHCGLDRHVNVLVTSEDAGVAKPDPEIFQIALNQLGLSQEEAVMVGDVWDTDIAGAHSAGLRAVWFNWRGLPTRHPAVPELSALVPVDVALQVICPPSTRVTKGAGRRA